MYVYTNTQTHTRARARGAKEGLRPPSRNHSVGRQGGPRFTTQHTSIVIQLFTMRPLPAGWLREGGPKALSARARMCVCVYNHIKVHKFLSL